MAEASETIAAQDSPVPSGVAAGSNIFLLSNSFNQDQTCFVAGTTAGFRVFVADPLREAKRREHHVAFDRRSVLLVEMLFRTELFAMVTVSENDPSSSGLHKVLIWDDRKGKFIAELRSRNEVKGIVFRKDIIVMVCEYAIYAYTCDKLQVVLHISTNANPRGLCVLTPSVEPWILACPGQSTGAVKVQIGKDKTHVFQAHQTGVAAMALTASGGLLATASENGTVVKVFQTADGQLLYRLRRSTRPALISSLAFRSDEKFLAVASSTSTVHIFKLDPSTAQPGEPDATASPALGPSPDPPLLADAELRINPHIEQLTSHIQKAVTRVASKTAAETVADVVKGVIPVYFKDLRSFAQFRIPDSDSNGQPAVDVRSKQAKMVGPQVAFHAKEPKLLVLHFSGILYECGFNPDHDPCAGHQDCALITASTWFAIRPDFRVFTVQDQTAAEGKEAGGAILGEEGAEDWQLL